MSPNREPKWLSKEPVSTADAEFNEALKQSPFVGAVAVDALAKFIKATDTARAARRSSVTTEAAAEQIITRIARARDAATGAEDETYAQLFDAQLRGMQILQAQETPQETPTRTEDKSMSSGKSNPE